jgi:very-short-patch-repair endonuclease
MSSIITKARYLRKEKTKAEEILWQKLRNSNLGIKFRRQHPLDKYILDFYAPAIKLAIEIDGVSHIIPENKDYDQERTQYLESKNISVVRFWNSQIEKDLENTLNEIKAKIARV